MSANSSRLITRNNSNLLIVQTEKSYQFLHKEGKWQVAVFSGFSHFPERDMQVIKVMLFPTLFLLLSPFQQSGTLFAPKAMLEFLKRVSVFSQKDVHCQGCKINYLKPCSQSQENTSLRKHCLLLFTPNLQEELRRTLGHVGQQTTVLFCCPAFRGSLQWEFCFFTNQALEQVQVKQEGGRARGQDFSYLSYCLFFWVPVFNKIL